MSERINRKGKRAQDSARTRQYHFVPNKVRKELIQLVLEEGVSCYMAAQVLKLNYSTAKAILKKFEDTGSVYRRKKKNFSSLRQQQIVEAPLAESRVSQLNIKLEEEQVQAQPEREEQRSEQELRLPFSQPYCFFLFPLPVIYPNRPQYPFYYGF